MADEIPSTEMATFFAAVVQLIRDLVSPFLLVIDYAGLSRTWDAPYALRQQLSDPDDPPPPRVVEPANLQFNSILDDPDLLLGFSQVYAAQITMLDRFLGIFLDQIADCRVGNETLVCLTSTRGYPLGEHGVVGHYREILHSESIHVPLLMRWPNRQAERVRAQSLVQPGLLYPLLCDWHQTGVNGDSPAWNFWPLPFPTPLPDKNRNLVISGCRSEDQSHYALQTLSWKMIRGVARHLYVYPDDRWEFNDVATLCQQVVIDLDLLLEESIARIQHGRPLCENPLPDALAFGVA
jgi:hypothetical protein